MDRVGDCCVRVRARPSPFSARRTARFNSSRAAAGRIFCCSYPGGPREPAAADSSALALSCDMVSGYRGLVLRQPVYARLVRDVAAAKRYRDMWIIFDNQRDPARHVRPIAIRNP